MYEFQYTLKFTYPIRSLPQYSLFEFYASEKATGLYFIEIPWSALRPLTRNSEKELDKTFSLQEVYGIVSRVSACAIHRRKKDGDWYIYP